MHVWLRDSSWTLQTCNFAGRYCCRVQKPCGFLQPQQFMCATLSSAAPHAYQSLSNVAFLLSSTLEMCSHIAHVIELGLVDSGSVRDVHVTAYLYSDGTCFWNVLQLVKAVLPGRSRKPCKLWDSWSGAALPVLRECGMAEHDLLQQSKRTLQARGEAFTDKTREGQTASTALVLVATILPSMNSGTLVLRDTYRSFSDAHEAPELR
eukprot:1883697-Amphidinium_carterae.4